MKDNKLIKFLIPLVAAVVVFESIVLVNNLEKSNNPSIDKSEVETQEVVEEIKEDPVVNFSFNSTNSAEMKVGKTYKVSLDLSSMEDKSVDGMETYIKYDPEFLKITNLTPNNKLVKPYISKINNELGMISNVVLIEDKDGMSLITGEKLSLLSFSVTPIEEGIVSLELSNGESNKNYATLIVETGTAKSLGWTGEKLDINITN